MGDRGPTHEVGTFSSRADDLRLGEILPVIHSRDSPAIWSTSGFVYRWNRMRHCMGGHVDHRYVGPRWERASSLVLI